MPKHIENSQYVHTPIKHPLQLHSIMKHMLDFMHGNCLLQTVTCLVQAFINTFSLDNHMISTKMIKDKGNLAVVECICKIGRTQRCLQNCDTEANITTFSQDASDDMIFNRRFDWKVLIGTPEIAFRNWMLMEPDESMTKEQLVAGESCAGKKWHIPINYYTNPNKRDVVS